MAAATYSYATFASASCLPEARGMSIDDSDSVEFWDMEEQTVDPTAETVPTFFESGQLMWEISTRTEGTTDQPCMTKPELVLTDSSFLSVSVIQGNLVPREDEETKRRENGHPKELLAPHCFELLTDEDRPLTGTELPVLREEMDIPIDVMIGDREWMEQQRSGYGRRRHPNKARGMQATSQRHLTTIKQPEKTMAHSASDVFSSYDPKFVIGEAYDRPWESAPSPLDGCAQTEEIDGRCSPRKPRRGLFKNVLCNAVSKFNDMLHNCHSKKKRPEGTSSKKQTSPNETPMHCSSACGIYRRRNTFMCQKMEGMINDKRKSSKQIKPSRSYRRSTGVAGV